MFSLQILIKEVSASIHQIHLHVLASSIYICRLYIILCKKSSVGASIKMWLTQVKWSVLKIPVTGNYFPSWFINNVVYIKCHSMLKKFEFSQIWNSNLGMTITTKLVLGNAFAVGFCTSVASNTISVNVCKNHTLFGRYS